MIAHDLGCGLCFTTGIAERTLSTVERLQHFEPVIEVDQRSVQLPGHRLEDFGDTQARACQPDDKVIDHRGIADAGSEVIDIAGQRARFRVQAF